MNNRALKLFVICVVFLCAHSVSAETLCNVKKIVDGDTIICEIDGTTERVRLLEVDTPESVHPDSARNVPMGKIASSYTESKLHGKTVTLEFEKNKRDTFGRLLAYVFVEKVNFNVELVREGFSPYYTKYGKSSKYDAAFISAETSARERKLNIWKNRDMENKYLQLKAKWDIDAKRKHYR